MKAVIDRFCAAILRLMRVFIAVMRMRSTQYVAPYLARRATPITVVGRKRPADGGGGGRESSRELSTDDQHKGEKSIRKKKTNSHP